MKKQVEAGLRPVAESIRGGFWAPYGEERYWQRQTQTWTLPALFHVYGNAWTMKELYGIWCEMPLMIQRSRRGQGETAKEHQANLQKTKDEVAAVPGCQQPWKTPIPGNVGYTLSHDVPLQEEFVRQGTGAFAPG